MKQHGLDDLGKDLLRLPNGMEEIILDKLTSTMREIILGNAEFPVDTGALKASGKFSHDDKSVKIIFDAPVKAKTQNTSYAELVETKWGTEGTKKFPASHYLYVSQHLTPIVINPIIADGMKLQWKK